VTPRIGTALLAVFLLAGCGGNQVRSTRVAPQPDVFEACCLEDRWEAPPENIGETPPALEAPEGALDPYQPER
jgi:hypothetical protein